MPVEDTLEHVAIRWVDVVILGGANRREAPHAPRGAEQAERCFRDAAGDEQRDQRQKQIPPMTSREGHDDDGQCGEQPVRSQAPDRLSARDAMVLGQEVKQPARHAHDERDKDAGHGDQDGAAVELQGRRGLEDGVDERREE